jgi:hypothetical protein
VDIFSWAIRPIVGVEHLLVNNSDGRLEEEDVSEKASPWDDRSSSSAATTATINDDEMDMLDTIVSKLSSAYHPSYFRQLCGEEVMKWNERCAMTS